MSRYASSRHTIALTVAAVFFLGVIAAGVFVLLSSRSEEDQPASRTYTMNEVERHDTKRDCWTVIDEGVYDVTEYINRHPGGERIVEACGKDATLLFNERKDENGEIVGSGVSHSEAAREQLERLKIGNLRAVK